MPSRHRVNNSVKSCKVVSNWNVSLMQIRGCSSYHLLRVRAASACIQRILTASLKRSNDVLSFTTGGERFTKVKYAGKMGFDRVSVISSNHTRELAA